MYLGTTILDSTAVVAVVTWNLGGSSSREQWEAKNSL